MTIREKPNTFRAGPDERGHFGLYGGRFVAETLMPLILELEQAYAQAKNPRPGWEQKSISSATSSTTPARTR